MQKSLMNTFGIAFCSLLLANYFKHKTMHKMQAWSKGGGRGGHNPPGVWQIRRRRRQRRRATLLRAPSPRFLDFGPCLCLIKIFIFYVKSFNFDQTYSNTGSKTQNGEELSLDLGPNFLHWNQNPKFWVTWHISETETT